MCASVEKSLDDVFFLKWHDFQSNFHEINKLRDEEELCDITFACQGKKLQAHKLVLFACSPYFRDILKNNPSTHPVFFMNDVKYEVLKAILEYMYLGEVHITNENLKEFIKIAEGLQIRGLSKENNENMALTNQIIDSNVNLFEEYCKKRTSTDTDTSQQGAKKSKTNDCTTESNVEPKVEMGEFIEGTSDNNDQAPEYCSYREKVNSHEKKNISLSFSDQTNSAIIQDYKSEDDNWIEKSFDSVSVSSENQQKTKCKNRKINPDDKAASTCLTPRCCPVCSRLYSNVSNLRQHMKLIHNPQAVCCPVCQKHFNSELYLKRHYSSIHSINSEGSIEQHKVQQTHVQIENVANDYQSRSTTTQQQTTATTTWNPYQSESCQIITRI